ncbi:hypothetical protein E3N88_01189 [Mikania micrantha]|nr:hypothetical protein E3N88_01189 [Mikania micrantha]
MDLPTFHKICGAPCLDARKPLNEKKGSILIKGTATVPPALTAEELFALHTAHIDRVVMESTPSPGVGH